MSNLNPTDAVVGSVVVFGAIVELSDEDPYMPAFYYDSPALIPGVVIHPVPNTMDIPDPDTATPPAPAVVS